LNIIFHKSGPLEADLTIDLVEEDYLPRIEQAILQYRSKVNLKGFRKGQVPHALVKKMYGPDVLLQTVMETVSSAIQNYVQEQKLTLWGDPIMVENPLYNSTINLQNPGNIQIKFECGLVPEVDLTQLNQVEVERWEIKDVADNTVDEAIKKIQLQYGDAIEVTKSEQGDMVYGILTNNADFKQLVYLPAEIRFEKNATDLLGIEVLEERTLQLDPKQSYALPKASAANQETLSLLSSLEGKYQFIVEKIYRTVPAELNETFFSNILGEDKNFTLEEFKQKFSDSFIAYTQNVADSLLGNNLKQAVIKYLSLELPETFIKKRLKSKNPTWEQALVDQFYAYMQPNLSWDLIAEKLGQEHGTQVTMEEIVELIKSKARTTKNYAQLATLPGDELKKRIEKSFASGEVDQRYKEAYDSIFQEKTLHILKDKVNIHTKETSVEEFNQMLDDLSKKKEASLVDATETEN
jgi:trigger factor